VPVKHHKKRRAHYTLPLQSCIEREPLVLPALLQAPDIAPLPVILTKYQTIEAPFVPVAPIDYGLAPWPSQFVYGGIDGFGGMVSIAIYRPIYNSSTVINAPVSSVTNDIHDSNSYVTNSSVSSSVTNAPVTNYATYSTSTSTDSHNVTNITNSTDSHNVTTYAGGGEIHKTPEIDGSSWAVFGTLFFGLLAVMRGGRRV